MPMQSSAKAALAALAVLSAITSTAKPALHTRAKNSAHKIEFDVGGRMVRVPVTLDQSLINFADDHDVRLLGTRGRFVLLVDSYASRKQGLSRCQSGNERYVRLIDLDQRRERFTKLAESCLKNIEPGDPIAAWEKDGRGFVVNSLPGPSASYTLDRYGRVRAEM